MWSKFLDNMARNSCIETVDFFGGCHRDCYFVRQMEAICLRNKVNHVARAIDNGKLPEAVIPHVLSTVLHTKNVNIEDFKTAFLPVLPLLEHRVARNATRP